MNIAHFHQRSQPPRPAPKNNIDRKPIRRQKPARLALSVIQTRAESTADTMHSRRCYGINFLQPLYFYLQKQQNAPSKFYAHGRHNQSLLILTYYSEETP